ncbi:MAG: DUF4407 domain-containing protein [Candidatus Marisimplicoccus sp.]
MNRDYYTSPNPNRIMRFLWSAAGADPYLLQRCTYTDHVKYACLGGIVLATGVMAALAGGYAFYIVFSPKGPAVITPQDIELIQQGTDLATAFLAMIFGCIWGLVIFNIDRFIVASTGKGDGTEAITSGEIKAAIPRIIMGIIIAITISKPVELRMFKTEVDVELQKQQIEKYNSTIKTVEFQFRENKENANAEIVRLRAGVTESRKRLETLESRLQEEITGNVTLGGSGVRGRGPATRALEDQIARALKEYESIKEINDLEIEKQEQFLSQLKDEEAKEKIRAKEASYAYNGLNARLKIVHEIVSWEIILFITLLFMSIELTPIFFKMMLIKSPYDFMNDNVKALVRAEKGIEIKHDFYKDKKGIHRDLIINHQSQKLLKEKIKLLQAQAELNEVVVESWKTKEIKNIQQNPESYINKES